MQDERGTAGPGTVASAKAPSLTMRAILALIFATGGASLVLIYREEITLALLLAIGSFGEVEGTGDIWFRFAIYASILILAGVGAWLFGERLPFGNTRAPVTLFALPSGVAAVALLLAAAWALGVAHGNPIAASAPGGKLFLVGFVLVLLQVSGEELLFRGMLQPNLVRAWGPIAGIVVGAIGFAAVHFAGGWRDPLSLLNISLAGIWFGVLAHRTGGVLAPILAHFGYNWSEEMLFGASPNPGVSMFGSVIDIDLNGAAILGGSMEGLNASILLSIALALLIALTAWRPRAAPSSGNKAATAK